MLSWQRTQRRQENCRSQERQSAQRSLHSQSLSPSRSLGSIPTTARDSAPASSRDWDSSTDPRDWDSTTASALSSARASTVGPQPTVVSLDSFAAAQPLERHGSGPRAKPPKQQSDEIASSRCTKKSAWSSRPSARSVPSGLDSVGSGCAGLDSDEPEIGFSHPNVERNCSMSTGHCEQDTNSDSDAQRRGDESLASRAAVVRAQLEAPCTSTNVDDGGSQRRRQRAKELSMLAREAAEVSALTRQRAQAALAELGVNTDSAFSTPRRASDADCNGPRSQPPSLPPSSAPVSSRSHGIDDQMPRPVCGKKPEQESEIMESLRSRLPPPPEGAPPSFD